MPAATAAAILARERSRSTSSAPNAASTQNMTKMSSSAVRLITNSSPSSASSSPATQPSKVDLVILRAMRAVSRMASEPTTAAANRHPKGVRPNSHSPPAMRTFPNGGCTTNSPPEARMWVERPLARIALAFLT